MTVLQLHILIEQALQQMGNFAYDDLEREEVDVAINYTIDKMLRKMFSPKDKRQAASISKDGFEDLQLSLDDFKNLKVEDVSLTGLTTVGNKVKGTLPGDYYHLINDRSVVNKPNCDSIESPNRLTDSEIVHRILQRTLSKTVPESPVSTMAANSMTVYFDGFTVTAIKIDYYKKPATVNFNVPANGAGVLEFPDSTCNKIAEVTAKVCSMWLEQPQLKVSYLNALNQENQ